MCAISSVELGFPITTSLGLDRLYTLTNLRVFRQIATYALIQAAWKTAFLQLCWPPLGLVVSASAILPKIWDGYAQEIASYGRNVKMLR